jgi:hypothetical protein
LRTASTSKAASGRVILSASDDGRSVRQHRPRVSDVVACPQSLDRVHVQVRDRLLPMIEAVVACVL